MNKNGCLHITHTYLYAYIRTYIYTYIHTYIYIYIYIYIYNMYAYNLYSIYNLYIYIQFLIRFLSGIVLLDIPSLLLYLLAFIFLLFECYFLKEKLLRIMTVKVQT